MPPIVQNWETFTTPLLAAKERMNLPLFPLPTSIQALDALIKKVEEQRTHITPVDSTPKLTVLSDTTLNSPSKRNLKNLRLKTDKKRLIDDDEFQTPNKRLPPAKSSDSEIKDEEMLVKATLRMLAPLKTEFHQFLSTLLTIGAL
ncbi:hypothetical protein TNCV_4840121 [Trichonephila clavipes]|nr:hypothetical protein TNCV_4840121 [Trichonephila clavipes]